MIQPIGIANRQPQPLEEHPANPRELSADEIRFTIHLDREFSSTREVSGDRDLVGQERILAALELGLGVSGSGYNIFVSGLSGAKKLETLQSWVAQRAAKASTPGDWVYVHNFKHPDAPRAVYLQPGQGNRL
ncbi:MAG TPA: Lon-like protease helical domain-containing protein, partial [Terriglobales bacterium]|nr:Lon-like protease helical domain-containing protein [Terriglobales bacterium]